MASDKEVRQLAMFEKNRKRYTIVKAIREKDIDPTEPLSVTGEKLILLGVEYSDYKMVHITDLTEDAMKEMERRLERQEKDLVHLIDKPLFIVSDRRYN